MTGGGVDDVKTESAEVSVPPGGKRFVVDHGAGSGFARALIVGEKESLVLFDRPAGAGAEAVVNPEGPGSGEKVARVQGVAIVSVECAAVKLVGAGFRDHGVICRHGKLRGRVSRHHIYLLDHFEARLNRTCASGVGCHGDPIHGGQSSRLRSHAVDDRNAGVGYRAGPGGKKCVGVKTLVSQVAGHLQGQLL